MKIEIHSSETSEFITAIKGNDEKELLKNMLDYLNNECYVTEIFTIVEK